MMTRVTDGLAGAEVDPGRHAWQRTMGAWHAGFAIVVALTVVLLLVAETPPAHLAVALALLTALSVWYSVVGARAMNRDSARNPTRRGAVYLAVAVPLTIALIVVTPPASMLLCLLYPHIWVMVPVRPAIGFSTVVAIGGTAAIFRVALDAPSRQVLAMLTVAGISLLASAGAGLWISRIIAQSRDRATLVAELAATRSELARVSHEAGMLAERERLAREIHDTVAQGATSVLLLLDAIEVDLARDPQAAHAHLARARDSAQNNLDEVRALIAALTPPQLSDASLPDALRRIVERIGPPLADRATVTVTGTPLPLPHDRVFVDEHGADHRVSSTINVAPAPGAARRSSRPPAALTRAARRASP
jgi:signal transduction histidine kinase